MEAAVSEGEDAGSDGDEDKDAKSKAKNGIRTKYDRMFERQNQDILADHYQKMIRDDDNKDDGTLHRLDGDGAGEDDDLFDVKRRIPADQALSPAASDDESVGLENEGEDAYEPKSISIPGAKTPLILDSKRREKLLKSKKKLLKLKDKGNKLVFDDEGNAHSIYELEDEDAFHARGSAGEQRDKFLRNEAKRVSEADRSDKALAREKRRAKKEKRKERERAEAEGSDGGDVGVEGREDAMANFLQDAASESEDEAEAPEPKRHKKWFEGKGKRRDADEDGEREIGTLEGLEAEAERLLG